MLKILSVIAGTLLIVVGVVAIFVPIFPQLTLILAGLALIGYANPRVRDALEPHVRRAEGYFRSVWARLTGRLRRR